VQALNMHWWRGRRITFPADIKRDLPIAQHWTLCAEGLGWIEGTASCHVPLRRWQLSSHPHLQCDICLGSCHCAPVGITLHRSLLARTLPHSPAAQLESHGWGASGASAPLSWTVVAPASYDCYELL
jgi:hypothetical protein